jgi:hypothetical protein
MINATRAKLQLAAAATMLVMALGLWLSSGEATRAASSNATQAVSATITNSIAWGTVGTCVQSAGAAAFGSLAAGSAASAPAVGDYTGCIASNATWSVTGSMTTAPASGANTIPGTAFRVESLTVPVGATAAACGVGNSSASCTLDNSAVSLVTNAPPTPLPLLATILTNGFTWNYKLNAPSNQASGAYAGGVVTLTASN